MSSNNDSESPADSTTDPISAAPSAVQESGFWKQFTETKVHLTLFLGLGLLGPLAMFVLLWISDRDRDRPLLDIVADATVTSLVGPSVLVGVLVVLDIVRYRKLRRVVIRQSSQAGSMLVSMLAARYRHYQAADTQDALKAAVLDVGAYLRMDVPAGVAASWLMDGARWYCSEITADQLPSLPAAQVEYAQLILTQAAGQFQ